MVKINYHAFNDLLSEEVEKELWKYKNSKYRWKSGKYNIDKFQIWTPKFFMEGHDLIYYFESIEKLKVGDKEQIEMLDTLNLLILLANGKNIFYDDEML